MTEPALTQLQRRVAALRQRRAAEAAARAAFAERREHGLRARQRAKLAYLATRTNDSEEPYEDQPTTESRKPTPAPAGQPPPMAPPPAPAEAGSETEAA